MSSVLPGPHPEPPQDLAKRLLPLLHSDGPWYRLHPLRRTPLYFGRAIRNRFDAPAGAFGALYAGSDAHCAFIETLGQAHGVNIVTASDLRRFGLCRVEARRSLALVDLTGVGLARLSADERLCAGDHDVARRWSLALWRHPVQPDGLYYRARHDPSRFTVVIYDRAEPELQAVPQGHLLEPAHSALLANILATYAYGYIDDTVP